MRAVTSVGVNDLSEGRWLKAAILAQGTVVDFAKRAKVSRATLNNWFQHPVINAEPDTLLRVLKALGFRVDYLEEDWKTSKEYFSASARDLANEEMLHRARIMNFVRWMVTKDPRKLTDEDFNVEPYSEVAIAEPIPLFELCVAAGHWVDVTDNQEAGHHVTEAQIRQGLFRVRLRGDSMKPRFPDGATVEFRLLRTPEGTPDFEATAAGECYYVQKVDGTATFKTLESRDRDTLVLRAINRRKYKEPLMCEVADVCKVAAFEWILSKGE